MAQLTTPAPSGPWSHRLTQIAFCSTITVCFAIFWYSSRLIGFPQEPRHGGSLFRQPVLICAGALFTGIVLIYCLTLLTTALLASRWMFAGLAATTAGLTAWSIRGGPIREVLFYAPSSSVFITLAVELLVLGGIVGAAWLLLWRAYRESAAEARDEEKQDSTEPVWIVILIQVLVMGVGVMVLAQTDAKKQTLAAVFIAGVVSTLVAEGYRPGSGAGKWYWIAPLLVGVAGYLLNWTASGGWASGVRLSEGFFAPLGRPLPLDYASAGIFGALLGYWMSQPEEETEEIAAAEPAAA